MKVAAAALTAIMAAGCGNTDSWVQAAPARAGRRNTATRPTAATRRQPGHHADTAMDSLGQGQPGCGTSAQQSRLAGIERPNPKRLFADGVGEQRQRPTTLVRAAGSGRWLCRPAVRRLRQRLRRSARGYLVVPANTMDPLAGTGDRNAFYSKNSRRGSTARGHPPGPGRGVRRASRHRGGQPAGSGRRRRSDRSDARASRLPTRPAGLSGRGGAAFAASSGMVVIGLWPRAPTPRSWWR
ncbi:putative conserved membrane protein [Mycobacterium xenopi 3993]|nr:putative conserved membrane protein [Mycobacterium xenopi 3993]